MARYYVAIEGPIGVGKTTLARLLHEQLGAQLLLEVFEENPFLGDFYADRAKYAFQTQIFFLLSRFRQQQAVIPQILRHSSLVSDYTFAKDQLFARLNLSSDELVVYETLHRVLAEKIPLPDLVVYLRADVDVLLERIATRDRSYERSMSVQYLTDLARAYDIFFANYDQAPVLTIDTNQLNIVRRAEDLDYVVERVKATLGAGTHQQPLLDLTASTDELPAVQLGGGIRRLSDLQHWREVVDTNLGKRQDVYSHFLALQAVLGMMAGELAQVWSAQEGFFKQVGNLPEAQARALADRAAVLTKHIANALSCLLQLSNDVGVNLEQACLDKIRSDHAE